MRWKLSKDNSFRQNEIPISDENNKSMSAYETNNQKNVFTITQLSPSELPTAIASTTTNISDNNITCQKYKPRSNEDSNFDNSIVIKTTATTALIKSNGIPTTLQSASSTLSSSSHRQTVGNIRRRTSFEEALKFQHEHHHPIPSSDNKKITATTTSSSSSNKYRDNNNSSSNSNGDIFIISSNQTEKQHKEIRSVPWANNISHHNNNNNNHHLHHNNHNHSNLGSDHLLTTTTSLPISITNQNNAINGGPVNNNNNGSNSNTTTNTNTATKTSTIRTLENGFSEESNSNNNFHYMNLMATPTTIPSSNGSINNTKIGSTTKLIPNTPTSDDQSSTQTQSKCSYFGGLLLCLCLNLTYTNIIRFPRELDQYGTAYLIPYFLLLFLVGLPILLLEVSIGQFLGQGAANTWRASPIFKGASVVSRFASWLVTLWISMHATLAIVYIGMLIFKSVPFSECASGVKIIAEAGYKENGKSGQECIQKTFLAPIWVDAQFFGFLTLGLAFIWLIMLVFTYNAKVFRRINFFIGTIGFILLISLAGWEIHKSLGIQYFPQLWLFNETLLLNSNIWFSALVQVIYSTNIGFGVIPVVTGKFLHKGDAIRTTILYFCFNLLIIVISIILFMVQFDNIITRSSDNPLNELKPLTAVYDKVINENTNDIIMTRLIPGIIYSLFVISAIISISIAIYTSSRLVPKHPSYILNLLGLVITVMALLGPKYIMARILDSRIVGTLVIVALIFDLIAITWIYGVKNIRTDLEFSIGRTVYTIWLILWCLAPIVLTVILIWWCVDDDQLDILHTILPRWGPIIFVIAIILIIACIEIFKQVDYNFFGMICEAAKPAKEWGPADPLARHAWKQWRSVCQDTGRKDFTLRRRGTRDYTHSIKKGQYSTGTKYGSQNWKSSTPGNSSPNYSGSVFGDSAIEEDMSIDKYSAGIDSSHQFTSFTSDNNVIRPIRYSNRSRKISHDRPQRHNSMAASILADKHREIVYIRRMSNDNNKNGMATTKIEITPANDNIVYSTRNPMASTSSLMAQTGGSSTINQNQNRLSNSNSTNNSHRIDLSTDNTDDHICWRKFSVNSEEYSTEL